MEESEFDVYLPPSLVNKTQHNSSFDFFAPSAFEISNNYKKGTKNILWDYFGFKFNHLRVFLLEFFEGPLLILLMISFYLCASFEMICSFDLSSRIHCSWTAKSRILRFKVNTTFIMWMHPIPLFLKYPQLH